MKVFFSIVLLVISVMVFFGCKQRDRQNTNIDGELTSNSIRIDSSLQNGRVLYQSKCSRCHQIGTGLEQLSGPHLNNLFNRKMGSVEGYRYSGSFQNAQKLGLVWNQYNLAEFIKDPQAFLGQVLDDPNAHSRMTNKLKDPEEIKKIVDYLANLPKVERSSSTLGVNSKCLQNPAPGIDFSGCNLTGVDFSNVDLSGANLEGTNFLGAKLTNVNFKGANLKSALLAGADLTEADFSRSDLSGASLVKAFLGQTKFDGANFSNTIWINGKVCTDGSIGECDYK